MEKQEEKEKAGLQPIFKCEIFKSEIAI